MDMVWVQSTVLYSSSKRKYYFMQVYVSWHRGRNSCLCGLATNAILRSE